jgi:hypothetical protein
MTIKKHYIAIFRENNFNCFPIAENQKVADYRYKASQTIPNQPIGEHENYGVLPTKDSGNAIIDMDNKEKYRSFAEHMITKGFMVIESPHGWHLPVVGLVGIVSKVELYDYSFQQKKIIEIQGFDHYCVGVGSQVFDKVVEKLVKYQNKGSDKIWNAKGMDFHQFIDELCLQCDVESSKRTSRSTYKNYRNRFLKEMIPTVGTSNDYFFQSALQCNTDGLSQDDAIEKIKIVYDKWMQSDSFSGRPFSNIEAKIRDVYDNDKKLEEGRPKNDGKIDRTEIAKKMIDERKMYSDVDTHNIYENCNGFLEKINNSLKRELQRTYPEMEKADYDSILFKLEGLSEPMPKTDKTILVFKDGVRHKITQELVESDEIADIGFKDYNYLPPSKENEPKKFLQMMFGNVPECEHPRIKAGLKAILESYVDSRISAIHGLSGVGKSTPLTVLVKTLGDYALPVELDQLLTDRFIRAKIQGKLLVVVQDLPTEWKDFTQIKTMTGESMKAEREFMKDMGVFENKIKIWASANYLAKIPENEKNAMYTRRLSLIHNTRNQSYPENSSFADEVTEEESEKIISWIFNLPQKDCKYEDARTVRNEWESLASPEIDYLQSRYEIKVDGTSNTSIVSVMNDFEEKTGKITDIKQMRKVLQNAGFIVRYNVIENMIEKPSTLKLKRNNTLD